VAAGPHGHGYRLGDVGGALGRGHKGQVQREGHDHHPQDQHQVGQDREAGAFFNHGAGSVLDFFLDKTELHHRQRHHDQHQDHRLRGRAAHVQRLEAVVVNLVNQNGRVFAGTALGGGVDDAEGVKKGINHVDHQKEKRGGRQEREHDGPKAVPGAGPVDGRRLQQGFGDGLQPRQKEQKVVGDLLPHGGHHDQ
ncbi:Uncharacterized protein APZ42_001930, partial [Daphnia magna]